jgi:hypothetical protein
MQMLLFLQQDYHIKHQKTTKVQSMDRILRLFFLFKTNYGYRLLSVLSLKSMLLLFYHLEDSCKNPEPLICFATL